MRECLDIKWDDLLDVDHSSLGEIWGKIKSTLTKAMSKHISTCTQHLPYTKRNLQSNVHLKRLIRSKHRLWNCWIQTEK